MDLNKCFKPKSGLKLRKIGRRYMIVDALSENVNMTDVFTLNEVAADIWKKISEEDISVCGLADWLCSEYEVEKDTALDDVCRQIEEWQKFGLVF